MPPSNKRLVTSPDFRSCNPPPLDARIDACILSVRMSGRYYAGTIGRILGSHNMRYRCGTARCGRSWVRRVERTRGWSRRQGEGEGDAA